MSGLLLNPRIPISHIKAVLVSGEYPLIEKKINSLGISTITTIEDNRLPKPVAWHPDMQLCLLSKETMFGLKGGALSDKLKDFGYIIAETENEPGNAYPGDVLCNALVIGNYLLGNPETLDPGLVKAAVNLGFQILRVKQGYSSCAISLINSSSAITADRGIAASLTSRGVDILLIENSGIRLPGYNTGFIGGCCGLINRNTILFTGMLNTHPDGEAIRSFIKNRGISIIELFDDELIDIGGIVPLQ